MRSCFRSNGNILVHIIIVTISYYIFARISLLFGISYSNVSPVWIPAGIAIAAIILWKLPVLIGIFAGSTLAVSSTQVAPEVALILGFACCTEALVFFYLFTRLDVKSFRFDTPENVFWFIVIGAFSSLIAGLLGVSTLFLFEYLSPSLYVLNLFTWWLGDLSGILIITPLILLGKNPRVFLSSLKSVEHILYYLVLFPCSILIFDGSTPYLFFIFILYAVFRLSIPHVTFTLFIGNMVAVSLVVLERGAFIGLSTTETLLSVQLFMVVTSIISLFLKAAIEGRQKTLDEYLQLSHSQENQIRRQTQVIQDSEDRFHGLFSNMHSGVVIYSAVDEGNDFFIADMNSAAEKIEGVHKPDIIGRSVLDVFPGVKEFGLLPVIKKVWMTGIPQRHPVSFYSDSQRSGWRDNYIYKIPNGEVVVIYDDVTEEKKAEETLKNTQEWLIFTQQAANAGSWDWDILQNTMTWSDGLLDLYGLPKNAPASVETWKSIVHPDDLPIAIKKITEGLKEKTDPWVEYRIILPDGTNRWIGSTGKTQYNDDGVPARLSGICLDISKKKEIERNLQKSEERLQYTLEAIDDGYWDWDIPSGRTFFNPRWYTMLGYEPYEMPESYETFVSLIHPEDKDTVLQKISEHFSNSPGSYEIEIRMRQKSGDYMWILTRGKVVTFDANNQPLRMVGTHTDISHRKRAEAVLRESEERYRSLVENVPDFILVHKDGIILYVNPSVAEAMGYKLDELYGTSLINYITPEYHRMIAEAIRMRMDEKDIPPYEIKIISKSGAIRTVVVRGCKIQYSGSPASLNVLTDITELKKKEEELLKFNEKLEQEVESRTEELKSSLKDKEVLLKEIHHRVKNNMQVVSSLLYMQARTIDQQEVKNVLLESQNRIKSIALVHEKLYQSNDFDNIDYTDYLHKIAHHIFESYKIDNTRISYAISQQVVYMNIDKAVPCSLIINELMSNSLKYAFPDNRSGNITITISHANHEYTILYEDDGIGIPDENSVDNLKTLGLQLVHGLIGQLRGSITLDKPSGSRFLIVFPE